MTFDKAFGIPFRAAQIFDFMSELHYSIDGDQPLYATLFCHSRDWLAASDAMRKIGRGQDRFEPDLIDDTVSALRRCADVCGALSYPFLGREIADLIRELHGLKDEAAQ